MRELTDEQKAKIEADALRVLSQFSDIVSSDRTSPEALVVATAAQAVLALLYFANECDRGDRTALAVVLSDVGVQIGKMIHTEALRVQREASHEVN
jgi:hypothetical protein